MCKYCELARKYGAKYCRPCFRKLFVNKKKGK